MQRTWTKVAEKDYTAGNHPFYEKKFKELKWHKWVVGSKLPFSQGMALKIAIQELKIPKVTHYAIDDGHPSNVYGLRGVYANGIALIYILDVGTDAVVLATDFYSKSEKDKVGEIGESFEMKLMNVISEAERTELNNWDLKAMILELITRKDVKYEMDKLSSVVRKIENDDDWEGGNEDDDLIITWKSKNPRYNGFDLSIGGNVNISWKWTGRYYPETRTDPASYPDLEVDEVDVSNLEFFAYPEKNYKGKFTNEFHGEKIPKDLEVKLEKWLKSEAEKKLYNSM